MAKINEKIDDLLGASKRVNADKTNAQREIGPSQDKSKGNKLADMMTREDERLVNRRKAMDKDVKPDYSDKDKVVPMTKEDAEVINSKEFKKASEGTKDMKKGGKVSSASKRADGCAVRGKTRA